MLDSNTQKLVDKIALEGLHMFLILFLFDGLLILAMLWVITRFLDKYREYITAAVPTGGMSKFARLMMIAPPVIIVIVAILFALVLRDALFLNFAHAIFLLAMWLPAIMLGLSFIILITIRSPYLFIAFLGMLCTFIPILAFTPTINFQTLFAPSGSTGYLLMLIEGVAIIVLCYPILYRLHHILKPGS